MLHTKLVILKLIKNAHNLFCIFAGIIQSVDSKPHYSMTKSMHATASKDIRN